MKVNKVLFNSSQNLFLSLHCNGQRPESGSLPLPPPAWLHSGLTRLTGSEYT